MPRPNVLAARVGCDESDPQAAPVHVNASSLRVFTRRDLPLLGQRLSIPAELLEQIRVASAVYPFRVNAYVVDELIGGPVDPDDPMFRLVFPQAGMLTPDEFERVAGLIRCGAGARRVEQEARVIRACHNPHPAGQVELNTPQLDGATLPGVQHKYRETVLYFPPAGQRCHAYCTYCFRWAQFVDGSTTRFAQDDVAALVEYLRRHREVSDVVLTGGDPMVMSAADVEGCIRPLLAPELDHIRTIRIGTKAPAYWPHRFVTDPDSDDLLRLFESVVAAGKSLAVMFHQSHPRELEPDAPRRALDRILGTGARIYTQAPVLRWINDSAEVWATMWRQQLALGCQPYYMFVERDTGPQHYFELPLVRAHEIFRDAYATLPGLARTVRGPVMSTTPGKVVIDGITELHGTRYLALRFLQARDPALVDRPFHAELDPTATWFSDLALVSEPSRNGSAPSVPIDALPAASRA